MKLAGVCGIKEEELQVKDCVLCIYVHNNYGTLPQTSWSSYNGKVTCNPSIISHEPLLFHIKFVVRQHTVKVMLSCGIRLQQVKAQR